MQLPARILSNLLYKLLVFPALILAFSRWFPEWIYFADQRPPVFLSILFIAIGLVADETILPWLGNQTATLQGFLFMAVVTWGTSFMLAGAEVTLSGAILLGAALGVVEYVMHCWLLQQREKETHHRP
ncbi:DUF2512 family protein [Brevibacillus migulae]|uniref:DUF2512 family protein n=1 Tax=Brevibacillus migulae TaxID=1644114 RepID=UPI00142F8E0F|nr:DUF2512 family protein [Brevibacillus migulae]